MKVRFTLTILFAFAMALSLKAQKLNTAEVPKTVRMELARRYPEAKNQVWSKDGGNYDATWTTKAEGESKAIFTKFGAFISIVTPTAIQFLPAPIKSYVTAHYHTAITAAHKSVSVTGKITYQIRIKTGKTLVFDQDGHFIG